MSLLPYISVHLQYFSILSYLSGPELSTGLKRTHSASALFSITRDVSLYLVEQDSSNEGFRTTIGFLCPPQNYFMVLAHK